MLGWAEIRAGQISNVVLKSAEPVAKDPVSEADSSKKREKGVDALEDVEEAK